MVHTTGVVRWLALAVGLAMATGLQAGKSPASAQALPPCGPPPSILSPDAGADASAVPEPDLPSAPPPTGSPWTITLTGAGAACVLDEVVRFGTGFAAARGTSVLLSPDGRSWPAAGIPIPGARRLVPRWPLLVEFKGALYAFGARRGGMHVWRLGDDARFVELSLPQLPDPVRRVESADAVAATADGLVVLGGVRTPDFDRQCEVEGPCTDTTFAWTTADGETWQVAQAANPDGTVSWGENHRPRMLASLWTNGAAFGALGTDNRILTSPDGVHWEAAGSLMREIQGIVGIGFRPSEGVTYAVVRAPAGGGDPGIPEGTAVVLRSTDLATWSVAYQLPWPTWKVTTADIADEGIVIGGHSDGWFPWMLLSGDGATWDLSVGWPGNEHGSVDDVAIGLNGVAAIGGGVAGEGPLAWLHPPVR